MTNSNCRPFASLVKVKILLENILIIFIKVMVLLHMELAIAIVQVELPPVLEPTNHQYNAIWYGIKPKVSILCLLLVEFFLSIFAQLLHNVNICFKIFFHPFQPSKMEL